MSNWNKFFFLLITLCLSYCFALGLEEDADDDLDNSKPTLTPSESPSSLQISLIFNFKVFLNSTGYDNDAYFTVKNAANDTVYGPSAIISGSYTVQVSQGYYTLWLDGPGLYRHYVGPSPYSEHSFTLPLQVSIRYLSDEFKIYNGPVQPSILLDAAFFITPLEEEIQTVKYFTITKFDGELLSYHYDDSSFETVSSLPHNPTSTVVLRYHFNYTASDQYIGMEVRLRSATSIRMSLNSINIYTDPWNRQTDDLTWCRFLVPASFLIEGRNVLSIRAMPSGNYAFDFDCKARMLRTMFFSDRWDKPSTDMGVQLFEAGKYKPYSFPMHWSTTEINYFYESYTVVTLTQFCIMANDLSSIPPRFELVLGETGIKISFTTSEYSSVINTSNRSVYCYNLPEPMIGSSFSCIFDSMNATGTYRLITLVHNGQGMVYEEEDRYPQTTFNRVTTRTCVSPYSTKSIVVFSLFDAEYQPVDDSLGVALNSTSGELCVDIGNSESIELNIGVFGSQGYRYVPINITRSTKDCMLNSTHLIHEGERVEDGECGYGYVGPLYQVCEDGALQVSQSGCVRLPPSPFSYSISPVYYISQELLLAPNTTDNADSFSVQPSLPSGLVLNEATGVISGSPSGPNGTYPLTVTATNDGGSAETSFTLNLMYPPCNHNGAFIPSGDRVYTRNCVGGSGSVYLVCENGVMSSEQFDECSQPSPFSYSISPVYYISQELSLSPSTTDSGITYTVQPSLPSGLSLNPSTGVISGSPSGPNGTYPLTVTATNEGGSTETSFTLNLMYLSCNYNGAFIPSGNRVYTRDCVGGSGSVYLVCENGVMSAEQFDECSQPSPFSYVISSVYYISQELSLSPNTTYNGITYTVQPSLPSGLSLNPSTGVISGSPSGPSGTYPLTVTATNDGGSAETSFTLNILYPPCNHNGESIPSGNRVYTRNCVGSSGRVYRVCENGVLSAEQFDECSQPSPFSYSLTSFLSESKELTLTPVFSNSNVGTSYAVQPSLPSGLNLNPSTGVISGSPSDATGTYSLTVTATNEGGESTTSFALTLSTSFVVPDADIFLVIYDCPIGYSGSRLHFSQEFNSDLTGGCTFKFADSFLYNTEPVYTLFTPMRAELNHAEVFDEFSIDPALPTSVSFDNATGLIEGVWKEPDNRTFTISATSSIDVQTVTLSLSFQYPPCKGKNGVEVSLGEEQSVKCFGWSVLGSKSQKCVSGEDGMVLEDLPNHCVEVHVSVFGAVLLVCVVVVIIVLMVVSLHPKVKVTIGEVYVLRVCFFTLVFFVLRHGAMTHNETPFLSCIILSVTVDVIMEETVDPMQQLNEYLSNENNVMVIANALFGSKGPTKYDVVEIKETSEGEFKKRSKCVKGKHLDGWFREKRNRDSCKLPEMDEGHLDAMISVVMNALLDSKLLHTARKPDNAKRIYTEETNVWNKKLVYSWDYDGPAGMRYFKIILTIAAVVAIPTYRIWPAFLQRIVMRLTLAITAGLIGLEIIRFLLFLVCRLFGYSIWIFPDLDRDDKGLFGVFYPLISVEKLDDGRNKYRYTLLAILVALIAVFAYNPQQAIQKSQQIVNGVSSSVQWVRGEWLALKLNTVEYIKKYTSSKGKVEPVSKSVPTYNPEDDETFDFEDTELTKEEDLMDLDELNDVKLDIEWRVCLGLQ